jgi:hypothetical protein
MMIRPTLVSSFLETASISASGSKPMNPVGLAPFGRDVNNHEAGNEKDHLGLVALDEHPARNDRYDCRNYYRNHVFISFGPMPGTASTSPLF